MNVRSDGRVLAVTVDHEGAIAAQDHAGTGSRTVRDAGAGASVRRNVADGAPWLVLARPRLNAPRHPRPAAKRRSGPPDPVRDRLVIRVVLADDQAPVREGLRVMLDGQSDITVVAEAGTGEEASPRLAACAQMS